MSSTLNFGAVTTFIFDVDGVLTDGMVLLLENGLQARQMNIKDGYALQLAVKRGYRIIIISGGTSEPVALRLNKLGITAVHLGVQDKKELVQQYMREHKLQQEQVLFMGDDLPDLFAMQLAGIIACPVDAVPEIKAISNFISEKQGGHGCVRDVIQRVLQANGHWGAEEAIRAQ